MSAKDRAERAVADYEKRLVTAAMDGLSETLRSPGGRAFIWWYYADNIDAEGKGARGRRQVARDLMRAAVLANWAGVQSMREEHERSRAWARDDAQAEEGAANE